MEQDKTQAAIASPAAAEYYSLSVLKEKISDNDMDKLAEKMADDYCNQLFWESMETIASEILGFPKIEESNENRTD